MISNNMENFSKTELENERWKDIFGYEGVYQVSDLGRVRSKHSGEWKVLKLQKSSNGYLFIKMHKDGKGKLHLVHRLVAQAFIPNDNIFNTEVNHIDMDRQNDRMNNLEWCDRQYNITFSSKRRKIKDLYNPDLSYQENIGLFKKQGIDCCDSTLWNLRRDLGLNGSNRQYVRNKIKDIYRPDLTIKQNIELFKENGVECSDITVQRLRRDLGLNGSNRQYVRNKIKDIYDPNLTYEQNIEVFRANGIECCRDTVRKLRKDLGLNKPCPQNVRNKVKDIYDPNLTYKENLEIFKANGVECSTQVIQSIRKELGLTKK